MKYWYVVVTSSRLRPLDQALHRRGFLPAIATLRAAPDVAGARDNPQVKCVPGSQITDSVAKTGKVAIYGIYFDTDRADLKPESKEAPAEMAKAIAGAGAGKKFPVFGHTDNQGAFEPNQTLSVARAKAVTAALTKG